MALWRLGSGRSVDLVGVRPPIWCVSTRYPEEIPTNQDVDFEGEGEILRVEADPTEGSRNFEIDAQTGDIDDETYTKMPTTYVIRRSGQCRTRLH